MKYIFLIFLVSLNIFASEVKEFHSFSYVVKKGDTFSSILKNFVNQKNYIYRNHKLVKKIIEMNPHVSDWSKLVPNTTISLFIVPSLANTNKVQHYVDADFFKDAQWTSISAFYMASFGSFEENNSTLTASTVQLSPITLGLGAELDISEKFDYSGSIYLSYLLGAQESANNKTSIPPEVGITSYVGFKKYRLKGIAPYVGFDFERFSTYDIEELTTNSRLSTRTNNFIYLTAGAKKVFSVKGQIFLAKLSLSKSFFSKSSSSSLSEEFSGYKLMLFLAYKLSDKWSTTFLFKNHFMDGPTELTVRRVGVGLGYGL